MNPKYNFDSEYNAESIANQKVLDILTNLADLVTDSGFCERRISGVSVSVDQKRDVKLTIRSTTFCLLRRKGR